MKRTRSATKIPKGDNRLSKRQAAQSLTRQQIPESWSKNENGSQFFDNEKRHGRQVSIAANKNRFRSVFFEIKYFHRCFHKNGYTMKSYILILLNRNITNIKSAL